MFLSISHKWSFCEFNLFHFTNTVVIVVSSQLRDLSYASCSDCAPTSITVNGRMSNNSMACCWPHSPAAELASLRLYRSARHDFDVSGSNFAETMLDEAG